MEENNRDFDATQHFDAQRASVYDSKIRKIVPGYETMHDLSLSLLHHHFPSQAHILVAGAGTGQEVIACGQVNPAWRITGVDPTEKMLSIAKIHIEYANLAERVDLHLGEVKDLPIEVHFDAATSILVMQFIPDNGGKKAYLKEIASRLKPGGKFIVIDLVGDKAAREFEVFLSAWKTRQLRLGEDAEEVHKEFEHILRDIGFITEDRMRDLLQEAGFKDICKFFQAYLFCGWIAEKA
ncbi:MAG TPA: methyltransferase domain-containing protein [Desulfurivibrionaceae bacterium]|jgi:tRNA (cmo5U34)-methyltransferase